MFVDRTADLGLDLQNAAACWTDLDNDGWVDLCAGGVVWRNNAGKAFTPMAMPDLPKGSCRGACGGNCE
ncbi:MAG: hypothetical protein R6X20_08240 [Phycisphaerae bacterium]